jgi:hypothetical protein
MCFHLVEGTYGDEFKFLSFIWMSKVRKQDEQEALAAAKVAEEKAKKLEKEAKVVVTDVKKEEADVKKEQQTEQKIELEDTKQNASGKGAPSAIIDEEPGTRQENSAVQRFTRENTAQSNFQSDVDSQDNNYISSQSNFLQTGENTATNAHNGHSSAENARIRRVEKENEQLRTQNLSLTKEVGSLKDEFRVMQQQMILMMGKMGA